MKSADSPHCNLAVGGHCNCKLCSANFAVQGLQLLQTANTAPKRP
jgi:hypothetical protein